MSRQCRSGAVPRGWSKACRGGVFQSAARIFASKCARICLSLRGWAMVATMRWMSAGCRNTLPTVFLRITAVTHEAKTLENEIKELIISSVTPEDLTVDNLEVAQAMLDI